MKPENEKKLQDLAQKYPSLFAFYSTKAMVMNMGITDKEILEALPVDEVAQILSDLIRGKDEISRVLDEIVKDEKVNSSLLSDDENKTVDDLLSFLDK